MICCKDEIQSSHPCSYAFGTVGVRQRVARLLKAHRGGANMGDHDRSAVPAQRVLSIKVKHNTSASQHTIK